MRLLGQLLLNIVTKCSAKIGDFKFIGNVINDAAIRPQIPSNIDHSVATKKRTKRNMDRSRSRRQQFIGFGEVVGWSAFWLTQLDDRLEESSITISITYVSIVVIVIAITWQLLQLPERGRKFEP